MDKEYIESRLPEKLKKDRVCPTCGGNEFYIQHTTFLYFSFDKDGSITGINCDHDDWNNTEQTKCTECGNPLEWSVE